VVIYQPIITNVTASGGNLVVQGTNGMPGTMYIVLTSTNLALPVINWTPAATNAFDGSGNFILTNVITPAPSQQFFLLRY
jgi:hypothetical protein